jgi:ABC-2 type transport system permease protein
MNQSRISVLLRKELLDVRRNIGALVPVAVVGLMSVALPFAITIIIPLLTRQPLGDDSDLLNVSATVATRGNLSVEGRVQLFLFQQFLTLFLLIPITGAMALAAHAVIGEKHGRTLEPLLATPITTFELLTAKVLGAVLPTLAITGALAGVYLVGIGWLAEPGVLRGMLTMRTAVLLFVLGPAAALTALQAALAVSSRVNDPRTAQQFSVLLILPLSVLLIAEFTGWTALNTRALAMVGVALFVVWVVLAMFTVVVFDRETILTRWR